VALALTGFRQPIREEHLDRVALVGALTAPIGVEIAALFEFIELGAADEKPPREQSVFLARAADRRNRAAASSLHAHAGRRAQEIFLAQTENDASGVAVPQGHLRVLIVA